MASKFYDGWINFFWGPATRVAGWASVQWLIFRRAFSLLVTFSGLMFVGVSAWISTIGPTGIEFVDGENRPFWIQMGAVSAIVLVLLRPLLDFFRSDGHLKHKLVTEIDKTDMKHMAYYMTNADSVTIYSGDFSYIYDYDPLYKALLNLARRGNLIFISYKSEEVVKGLSEVGRNDKECIIEELLKSNNIFFDVRSKAKFSLIYRKGEEVLLYRHREGDYDYITIFRATNAMTKQLVETMKALLNVIIKA